MYLMLVLSSQRRLPHLNWQGEMKGGASSVVGRGPQSAAMRFHNGTADRQAHAAALRLSRKEGGKDLIQVFRR